ncbi:DUF177 domain-containing protein [Pseudodesulfovibrio sp. zrk46]|uniref:DUF177 domain-containing protein n=1 Tax=Pseudodesulfovibrio sp. zrk46 TaxID=2725288 RepID=UPI001448A6FC|nr:DUF177 domain-containing protein [Pseudodesulfovibrio sp. zrk46]QJB55412.1 DUF177 domain-containing protein [Pseudodesulfovibrio sp. zrk46]
MIDLWIPISDISHEGKDFVFDDQSVWQDGWKQYSVPAKAKEDLVANVTILPQSDNGALVRGSLKGSVVLPCDRCMGDFVLDINETFDVYEQLPDEDFDDEPRVRKESGQLQLNIGAILWEEFAVTLPVKPLCSEGCKGMCPDCGKDLNKGNCECERDEGDERLAVFRNLKIK